MSFQVNHFRNKTQLRNELDASEGSWGEFDRIADRRYFILSARSRDNTSEALARSYPHLERAQGVIGQPEYSFARISHPGDCREIRFPHRGLSLDARDLRQL